MRCITSPSMDLRHLCPSESFVRYTMLLILLLLAGQHNARGLDRTRSLDHFGRRVWQTDEGLPQNTVSDILQSADGYIWIGTGGGLARFDGVHFRVFDRRTTPELHSNLITSLYEDSHGVIWIGTPEGLTSFDGVRWSLFTVRDGLPSNQIFAVYEDHRGMVWILTANGIARYDNGRLSSITAQDGLLGGPIIAVHDDNSGGVWIATENGLNKLTGSRNRTLYKGAVTGMAKGPAGDIWITTQRGLASVVNGVLKFVLHSPALPVSSIDNLLVDHKGHIWLGSATGLAVWDGHVIAKYTTQSGLPGNHIYKLFEDREGAMWVSTDGGLARIVNGQVDTLSKQANGSTPLILTMFEDREGSLWLGTDAGGLIMLRDQNFTSYTSSDGLTNVNTKTVIEDSHHTVWVGTDGGGLSRFRNNKFKSMGTPGGLSSDVVSALADDSEGGLWIGTPDGLNHLQDGHVSLINFADGLPDDYVRSLLQDADKSLWIGTGHGLCRWKDGKLRIYTEEDGLSSNFIGAMTKDGTGTLWIGTSNGLDRWKQGKFYQYTNSRGLANYPVTALYAEATGVLWIGTKGGGLKRMINGTVFSYESVESIPENIYGLVADQSGNLWIASDKGVYRANMKVLGAFADGHTAPVQIQRYGTADGMPTSECSSGGHPSVWRSDDGTLWFTTPRGITSIRPDHANYNRTKPPVVIEQVSVDDSSVPLSSPLVVAPGHARYEFRYAGLSFIAPQDVRYRYKLDGFDQSWTDAGARRRAYYTNLKPGNYRFRVIAANNDGVWNDTGTSFYFRIKPHFYQTLWFYCALFLLLGWLLYQLYHLRMKRVAMEFNAAFAERNRLAREIHDTLAQGFVAITLQLEVAKRLFGDKDQSIKEHLDQTLALANSSLSEARRSIWELRSQGSHSQDFPALLAGIVQQARMQSSAEITLKITGAYRTIQDHVGKELLKIAQEATLNAARHADARHVYVLLAYEETQLRITITDDGRGINESRKTLAELSGHFGLIGMKERAKLIGAMLLIESQADLGTTVVVEIVA
jgi:ligand-binding sensor domain-containing protein/signal transduction histidine kinase